MSDNAYRAKRKLKSFRLSEDLIRSLGMLLIKEKTHLSDKVIEIEGITDPKLEPNVSFGTVTKNEESDNETSDLDLFVNDYYREKKWEQYFWN